MPGSAEARRQSAEEHSARLRGLAWIDLAVWDEMATNVAIEEFEPGPAWVGVDLSSTGDLTAVAALFERGIDELGVVSAFFVPEEGISRRSSRDSVSYAFWAEQGHITATPGAVVDYAVVEDYVASLAERFRVEAIAIDRWNSTATTTRLLEQGLPSSDSARALPA